MYNSQRFEEVAFEIYLRGMLDYEQICERKFMEKYDDVYDFQKILDQAQAEFEEMAGGK